MAKTDWTMNDTVMPEDMNDIGQEINEALSNAQNAQNTADAAVLLDGSKPMSGPLTTPKLIGDIDIPDTRAVSLNPEDISQAITTDFKSGSSLGLSGGYYVVWTFRGWHDDSGGPATQLAFGADGPWIRLGTEAAGWGPWAKIWTSQNDNEIRSRFDVLSSDPANPPVGYAWIVSS